MNRDSESLLAGMLASWHVGDYIDSLWLLRHEYELCVYKRHIDRRNTHDDIRSVVDAAAWEKENR